VFSVVKIFAHEYATPIILLKYHVPWIGAKCNRMDQDPISKTINSILSMSGFPKKTNNQCGGKTQY
jgi:hypothetical protein